MFFLAFDERPFGWLLISLMGVVLLVAVSGWEFWKKAPVRLPDAIFLAVGLGLLAWGRLPILLFNQELNPDESQMISHAITLAKWPVYWRSVDGTTIGPLDLYALLLPRLLGLGFDYTAARVLGLLCIGGSLLFLFLTLRRLYGTAVARLVWLPTLLFLAFTQIPDFVHYSSEHVPVLLLAGATWLLSQAFTERSTPPGQAYLLGLLLGMVPFGKLQGVPAAGVVALFAALAFWRRQGDFRNVAWLVAGGLTFPLLVVGLSAAYGVLDDLYTFYIVGNLQYGTNQSLLDNFRTVSNIWFKSMNFRWLTGFSVLVLLLLLPDTLTRFRISTRYHLADSFVVVLLLGSYYAILRSGFPFTHYLHWMLAPLTLLNGLLLAVAFTRSPNRKPVLVGLFLVLSPLTMLGPLFKKIADGEAYNAFRSTPTENRARPESDVSQIVARVAQPGDALVVWGWQCRYYVESGLPQGTAENHTERCIFPIGLRDVYRARFLDDFRRTRPPVFVDAVGENSLWVRDRATQGYECFPELADYVREQYTYAGLVDDCRIYVRNDRLPAAHVKTNDR